MGSQRNAAAKFLRLGLAAALILSSASCYIKNPKYPSAWPELRASGDVLSEIEGSFSCSGEIIGSNTALVEKRSITDFLIGGKSPQTCEYIEIVRPEPDEIDIRFMWGGGEFLRQHYKKDRDYEVEDGWVVLKSSGSWAAEDVVVVHGTVRPYLRSNADGDLIIKAENSVAGTIFLVIPAGSSGTDWGRFKRRR